MAHLLAQRSSPAKVLGTLNPNSFAPSAPNARVDDFHGYPAIHVLRHRLKEELQAFLMVMEG